MTDSVVSKKIKEIAKSKGITIKNLAINIGMTEQGLYAAMKNNTLKINTLNKIADFLKVSSFSILNDSIRFPFPNYIFNVDENGNFIAPGIIIEFDVFENLKEEIKFNAKIGKGLIFIEYDAGNHRFITAFENLKEPVKQDYLEQIEHSWPIDEVIRTMEKDSKGYTKDENQKE